MSILFQDQVRARVAGARVRPCGACVRLSFPPSVCRPLQFEVKEVSKKFDKGERQRTRRFFIFLFLATLALAVWRACAPSSHALTPTGACASPCSHAPLMPPRGGGL